MKKEIILLSVCALLTLSCAIGMPYAPIVCVVGFVLTYLTLGFRTIKKAVQNILNGQMLDEHFLMTVATIGAFAIGEYAEAVAVMLFYRVGELFERMAVRKSRRSIASLMNIRPDCANLLVGKEVRTVAVEEVRVGDLLLIRAGEKVPLDGEVEEGESTLDTAALTGEALPRAVAVGDEVVSGCINQSGTLKIRVTKPFAQSTVMRILELVEHASAKKSKQEAFITRFARWYTPIVTGAALLLAVVPPIFLGNFSEWVSRALSFLVVSCPCALVISVPLAFFGGIGGAARKGILMKGGNHLEALAKADVLVCDKTGTLTTGRFVITEVSPVGVEKEKLLALAASAEKDSSHPLAQALQAACPDAPRPTAVWEKAGGGVKAQVGESTVCVGNRTFLQSERVNGLPNATDGPEGNVFVSCDGNYIGSIALEDAPKADAPEAIAALRAQGVTHFAVLTGDAARHTLALRTQLQPDEVIADLLPQDKVARLEEIMQKSKGATVYVGDGINDAPVLMRADVGVAMGAFGSDAAMEAADIVLMNDRLCDLVQARRIAKKTRAIARQNTVFAIAIKLAVLVLCGCGVLGMWAAVFADVGVSVLAICNALRLL